MKTFTDNAGRTWQLALNIGTVRQVKNLLGVNLAEIHAGEPPLLTRLATDVVLLADVIFALVKSQADAQGVTDLDFAAAMGGDAITAAHDALMGELADFFRSLRRSDLVRAIEKQATLVKAAVAAGEARIEKVDVEKTVASAFGSASTSSPASSA